MWVTFPLTEWLLGRRLETALDKKRRKKVFFTILLAISSTSLSNGWRQRFCCALFTHCLRTRARCQRQTMSLVAFVFAAILLTATLAASDFVKHFLMAVYWGWRKLYANILWNHVRCNRSTIIVTNTFEWRASAWKLEFEMLIVLKISQVCTHFPRNGLIFAEH